MSGSRSRVIIFGCGPTGLRTYEEVKSSNEVIAFFDNDTDKAGNAVDNIPVMVPNQELLNGLKYDYIIVASVYGKWEIRRQLHAMGVPDDKIKEYTRQFNVLIPFLKNLSQDFREENIKGACAEVGVFRGESAQYINSFFCDRELHLYDTFDGFDERDIHEEVLVGRREAKVRWFDDTSEAIVMEKMKFPSQVFIHKGYFPDTALGLDKKFCFVRIDMDLYAPTKAALDLFYGLMVKGGVILIHDYFGGQYPGIKKVVREFIAKHPELSKIPIGDMMSIAIVGF